MMIMIAPNSRAHKREKKRGGAKVNMEEFDIYLTWGYLGEIYGDAGLKNFFIFKNWTCEVFRYA